MFGNLKYQFAIVGFNPIVGFHPIVGLYTMIFQCSLYPPPFILLKCSSCCTYRHQGQIYAFKAQGVERLTRGLEFFGAIIPQICYQYSRQRAWNFAGKSVYDRQDKQGGIRISPLCTIHNVEVCVIHIPLGQRALSFVLETNCVLLAGLLVRSHTAPSLTCTPLSRPETEGTFLTAEI